MSMYFLLDSGQNKRPKHVAVDVRLVFKVLPVLC